MSTKSSIAYVELTADVGGVTYNAHLHVFNECFDEPPQAVHIEMWLQGVFSNTDCRIALSEDEALKLADDLAAWAASIRKHREAT